MRVTEKKFLPSMSILLTISVTVAAVGMAMTHPIAAPSPTAQSDHLVYESPTDTTQLEAAIAGLNENQLKQRADAIEKQITSLNLIEKQNRGENSVPEIELLRDLIAQRTTVLIRLAQKQLDI